MSPNFRGRHPELLGAQSLKAGTKGASRAAQGDSQELAVKQDLPTEELGRRRTCSCKNCRTGKDVGPTQSFLKLESAAAGREAVVQKPCPDI